MTTSNTKIDDQLRAHAKRLSQTPLSHLVEQPGRLQHFVIEDGGLYFDFSKHIVDESALKDLCRFAEHMELLAHRQGYLNGDRINETEDRSVLHTALRLPKKASLIIEGRDVVPQVHEVLERAAAFVDGVHNGDHLGYTGEHFTDVVNIGIGGSDLGPAMAYKALWPYHHDSIRVHYVSNIDGTALTQTLGGLDPARTLFVIASKTFTTQETLTNAHTARAWIADRFGNAEAIAAHFVAVSTNAEAVEAFGIHLGRMFPFWDWVGGRFSVWSSIGLSLMLGIGSGHFRDFLKGAHAMDLHFEHRSIESNAPMLMALLGVWYTKYFGASAHAILPYDEGLGRLPAFLQQGEMESNGKSVNRAGQPVGTPTCPVIFGEAGTNGQHAFYQLIHQGTHLIPCDFILPLRAHHELSHHHDILASHCFAQTEALMRGRSREAVVSELRASGMDEADIHRLAPHRVFEGNRPSTTILMDALTPTTLGQLISAYEHKIFVQGILWDVFSYDQWGVELGKVLAKRILPALGQADTDVPFDASTAALIQKFKSASASHD